ncbi:hypothetical protein GCK32_018278 [Trichostrongylus colubriformis]|uniref:G-protein coupled receptors family 1 profile domain-containing protein n=1 Tax=Trichostrongylus colubriformis TaxID=6319 RepID=A0AAN8IDI1_TRICO
MSAQNLKHCSKRLVTKYFRIYLCGHIIPSLCLSATVVTWILTERTSEEYVICAVTVPLHGSSRTFLISFLGVTSILTAACYLLCFCLIRLHPLDEDIMKQVYRSLGVISLTVLFGWISGVLISLVVEVLELQVDEVSIDLITGLFVNSATVANFFVYYAVSGMYREVFNKYLLKRRFKRQVSVSWRT